MTRLHSAPRLGKGEWSSHLSVLHPQHKARLRTRTRASLTRAHFGVSLFHFFQFFTFSRFPFVSPGRLGFSLCLPTPEPRLHDESFTRVAWETVFSALAVRHSSSLHSLAEQVPNTVAHLTARRVHSPAALAREVVAARRSRWRPF